MNTRLIGTFGSFLSDKEDYNKADVFIIPIGYEESTSYIPGTKFGPSAIIEASHYLEFYDIELDCDVSEKFGIYTLPEPEFTKSSIAEAMQQIKDYISLHAQKDKFMIVLGGEHSITPPIVSAWKGIYPDLSVLHFDAHSDMRDFYEGTKFSHACPMRRCREMCPVVQVGIRSMGPEEASYIKEKDLNKYIFYARDMDSWDIDKILSLLTDNVYISFDFDCFDPSIMPSVGTPEPGGVGWYKVLSILKKCFETKNVIACDAVELCPANGNNHSSFTAALLIYKMISYKYSLSKNI